MAKKCKLFYPRYVKKQQRFGRNLAQIFTIPGPLSAGQKKFGKLRTFYEYCMKNGEVR